MAEGLAFCTDAQKLEFKKVSGSRRSHTFLLLLLDAIQTWRT
jgi:hypothetical protein